MHIAFCNDEFPYHFLYAGFPSGHVMSIAAVGLHIVLAVKHCIEQEERLSNRLKQLLIWTVITSFLATTTFVAISRVYIATHFPHQVIAAVFIGFLITYLVRGIPNNIDLSGKKLCCITSMSMLLFAFLFYSTLILLGYDPSITVEFARKWCKEKDWVHLDTTPFYAVVRDCASLFGLGMACKQTVSSNRSSIASYLFCIIIAILPIQILESIRLPTENMIFFYCSAYVKFAFLSVVVTVITPFFVAYFNRHFACKVMSKIE